MIQVTTTRKSATLYTGVMGFKLVGLNPTADELGTILGTEIEREPVYTDTDRDGSPRLRLDFWFKNEEFGVTKNFPIWLIDEFVKTSSNGKTQFMGANGLSTYAADESELLSEKFNKWIFPDTRDGKPDFRPAHVGEADLYQMLIALFKSDTRNSQNTIIIDTDWSDFVAGDIDVLRKHLTEDMTVQLLVTQLPKTLDDGTVVWNTDFYRKVILSEGDSARRIKNQLKKDEESGYAYKGNYQDSFAVKEFDPTQNTPEATLTQASPRDIGQALNI